MLLYTSLGNQKCKSITEQARGWTEEPLSLDGGEKESNRRLSDLRDYDR
jgi:hypothetical protein